MKYFMVEVLKQLFTLLGKTDKVYLIPIILLLIIVALLVISSSVSPVPIFIYPLI